MRDNSGTLEERVQQLEARLAAAQDTIASLREHEQLEARRHSKALASATDTMADLVSRVKQVEERVVPELQVYVDKSHDSFWEPSRKEIAAASSEVQQLRLRIDEVDDSASSLITAARDQAAQERRSVREERLAEAAKNLSRFQTVDKALSEEREERVVNEGKLRKELESMAKAIADAIRDADAGRTLNPKP